MTNHRNIIQQAPYRLWIGLLLLAVLLMSSCEKLDFPNPNAPVIEDVPISTLVTGIEAGMRTDLAIYLRVVGTVGREIYYFEPADPRYTGELLFNTPDPGGFLLNRPWSGRYQVIADCRFMLEKSAKELAGAEKAAADGFAKTMMAYQLLLNLNLTNSNGLQLDFSGTFAPFASKTESFAFIENLLDDGAADLSNGGDEFPFGLSPGFADFPTPAAFRQFNRAIRARVAVYQAKWQDALNALDESFLDESKPLEFGAYHVYGSGLGDQLNNIFESTSAPFVKLMAHPSFASDAEAGDQRFASKVAQRPEAQAFDNLSSSYQVTITESSTDPLPIIRNEELILLRAEANIGLNNLPAAETDINFIRSAAGLASVTLSAQNALDQVLHEKRYSLFMEGHRWVDLRRYDRLNTNFVPLDRPDTDDFLIEFPPPETEISG